MKFNRQYYKEFWQHASTNSHDKIDFSLTYKKICQLIIGGFILILCLITFLAFTIWHESELQTLRQQNELHQKQMDLLREKTENLQEKMKVLDSLDQELRQMVKGAENGESPKGEGGIIPDQFKDNSKDNSKDTSLDNADLNTLLHATHDLETKINARLVSFVTLRTILSDTAGEQVRQMQEQPLKFDSTSVKPSIWPVNGPISSPFGWRRSPVNGASSYHEGIDIAVDYGTPVHVTAAGTVTLCGWTDGYGNLVEVNHGNSIVTRYGHNSILLVTEGQAVKAGDIISLAGSTGISTGPHVHYEVRINGTPVNPLLFLPTQ